LAKAGLTRTTGHTGAVTLIQRFGAEPQRALPHDFFL
jgi:hypothetical protein